MASVQDKMGDMLNDLHGTDRQLNWFSGNKDGGQPRPGDLQLDEVKDPQFNTLTDNPDDFINKKLEGDVMDDAVWEKIKAEHEEECSKMQQEKLRAERDMFVIRCRAKWLNDHREIKLMEQQADMITRKEHQDRRRFDEKLISKVNNKVQSWLAEGSKNVKGKMRKNNSTIEKVNQVEGANALGREHKQRQSVSGKNNKGPVNKRKGNKNKSRDREASQSNHTRDKHTNGVKQYDIYRTELSTLKNNENLSVSNNTGLRQLLKMNPSNGHGKDGVNGDSQDEDAASSATRSSRRSGASSKTSWSAQSSSSKASSKTTTFYGDSGDEDGTMSMVSSGTSVETTYKVSKPKKVRSGMYDKPNDDIIRKMRWPHRGLEYTYRAQGLDFGDMTYYQYIMGESKIIALTDEQDEQNGRLRLMNKIAYAMDETNNWSACRDYCAAVVVAIEMGEEEWTSNHRRFESVLPRIVYTIDKQYNTSKGQSTKKQKHDRGDTKRRVPETCFCKLYNRGTCSEQANHMGKYKEEAKLVFLQHICAKCLLKNKEKSPHPENSEACPLFERK